MTDYLKMLDYGEYPWHGRRPKPTLPTPAKMTSPITNDAHISDAAINTAIPGMGYDVLSIFNTN